MHELKGEEYKRFEGIKHIRDDGSEFWPARELAPALEYNKWENFDKVIKRAMIACENSGHVVADDFPEVRKIVSAGITIKPVKDYELTRYACYLIVQNGDPRKEVIALGKRNLRFFRTPDIWDCMWAWMLMTFIGKKLRDTWSYQKDWWHNAGRLTYPKKSIQQIEKEQLARLKVKAKTGKLMLDE